MTMLHFCLISTATNKLCPNVPLSLPGQSTASSIASFPSSSLAPLLPLPQVRHACRAKNEIAQARRSLLSESETVKIAGIVAVTAGTPVGVSNG